MPLVKAFYTLDGKAPLDPQHLYDRCLQQGYDTSMFWGRCNSFFLPRGKDPGRGFILLLKSDFDSITSGGDNQTHTLVWTEGANVITISNLYIVGHYSLLGGQVENDNDVYMVELSDARCLAPLKPINWNYNLVTPDAANEFDDSVDGDYTTVVADLYSNVPSVFTSFTDGGTYPTGEPKGYCFHGISSWDALFQVLDDTDNIGYVSRTGAFKVISAADTDAANQALQVANLGEIIHSSHARRSDVISFPEKVRVYFPRKDYSFQTNADVYQVTGTEYYRMSPLTAVDVNTVDVVADAEFKSGTIYTLFDSLEARYDRVGAQTNAAALTTRATERATSYLNSVRVADGYAHQVYSGLVDFVPGPRITSVAWMDLGDGVKTEIFLTPREKYTPESLNFKGESLFNASALVACRDFSEHASSEYPGPPDIGRDHMPFDRWAVVELYDDIPAYGSGLAYVKYSNNSFSFTASTKQITVIDIGGTPLQAGATGLAMFHTQARTWIVMSAASNQSFLFRFELTEELLLGDEAAAEIVIFFGGNYISTGIAITVRDFTDNPGSWAGFTGYQGWCAPAPNDSGVFEIIWMETIARYVNFELDTPISGGSATASADFWWNIKDPGAALVLDDREGLWEGAPAGARGFAIWDEKEEQYAIIRCEHYARWIYFTLYDDWAAPPATFKAEVNEYWEGLDPADNAGQVDLLDRGSLFRHARGPNSVRDGGCKGYAVYDQEFGVYVPVVCQQIAFMLRCKTNEAFTSADADFDVTLPTDQVFAIGREQWVKIPIETTLNVKNILAFDGDSGAWCYIVWNFTAQQWELLQTSCPA